MSSDSRVKYRQETSLNKTKIVLQIECEKTNSILTYQPCHAIYSYYYYDIIQEKIQ